MFFESIESKRYSKKLHNLLLKVFHDQLEDPIFKRITINYLRLNRNKTMATVFLDLTSTNNSKEIIEKLNRLNGLFRKFLSEYLDRYSIPFFKFVEDKVFDRAQNVENLIKKDIDRGKGD